MRETKFIEQNKDKWAEFERVLESENNDPEKLNNLFVQITDDLSYSRTFYPNRSVRVYLNSLAQKVFFRIYKNRKSDKNRLVLFWTEELPHLMYNARKELLLSFFLFLFAVGIGVLSGAMDPQFAEIILGESYVDMTLENIESGDPMAVYKDKGAFGMSFGITANNLFVSFLTFVMGIFAGLGTIIILFRNGIMLGAFQYFFIERDLFVESFLTIWTHGTLEISAIIIAGAAGLTMGKGLVFPETYTRLQAFQRSARRGLKIMAGIVPIIIAAGFIEGYLTRFTETPDIIRLIFILLCLAFVLSYYVWYPRKLAKEGFKQAILDRPLPPSKNQVINYNIIKSTGDIFSDIFVFYKKYFNKILLLGLTSSLIYTLLVFLLTDVPPAELFVFPSGIFGTFGVIDQFFSNENIFLVIYINLLTYSIFTFGVFTFLLKEANLTINNQFDFNFREESTSFLKIVFCVGLCCWFLWLNEWYTFFLITFGFPIIMLWAYTAYEEKHNIFTSLSRSLQLIGSQFGQLIGLFLTLTILNFLFFSIMDTMVVNFFFSTVTWVLPFEQELLDDVNIILLTFITVLSLNLLLAIVLIGSGFLYYSFLEIQEATSLKQKIQEIGNTRYIRGLERE